MAEPLQGMRVAILVANEGVEQIELTEPMEAMSVAGAEVHLLAPKAGAIQAFEHLDKADRFTPTMTVAEARPEDYDGLILPGGVANPDNLRTRPEAVEFVRRFFASGQPIGAICHAPWLLIEAEVVRGFTLTSFPSLQTDLRNAGAKWVDQEVCVDEGLITSRRPDDLPAFNATMIEEIVADAFVIPRAGDSPDWNPPLDG